MKSKALSLLTAAVITVSLSACVPPYRDNVMKKAAARGYTKNQQLAAFHDAYREYFSREIKNKDGTLAYEPNYSLLSVADIREEMDHFLAAINNALDCKDEDNCRFLDTFNLRADLEREERVGQLIRSRLKVAEHDLEFKKLMGSISQEDAEVLIRYDPKRFFLVGDLRKEFPFISSQIENAKARGILVPIENITFAFDRKLDRKDPDPAHLGDPNEFIWKSKHEAIAFTTWKIVGALRPDNNNGDYIEGFRVTNGKKESRAALKMFFPDPNDHARAIVVIDSDREGEPEFGLPDYVTEYWNVENGHAILMSDGLMSEIFEEKGKDKRIKPPAPPPIHVEIAKIGNPYSPWEMSADVHGWLVPFRYQNLREDSYNIHIKFKRPHSEDATTAHEVEYLEVEYVAKEWTGMDKGTPSIGTVWEYYRPKGLFAGEVRAHVVSKDDTKKVEFNLKDGSTVTGFITSPPNKFIEDVPYAISYNEGQTRWWIEKDPKSKVFNKRKQVAPVATTAGDYSAENREDR